MSEYIPTIGLEIHAELRTKTKMFCNSKNDADETCPNVNICPVCLAHPGTLPVINGEAVRHVLRVGIALGARLADYTEFDRKSYFYPDLPKGYQLSQYEYPLVSGGELQGVAITRVHLEEDTASSQHVSNLPQNYAEDTQNSAEKILRDSASSLHQSATLVDYNRAGIPLMELVTEPAISSAKQAGDFARELQLLLRYLNVSNANMEKGEMRVEANISVSKDAKRGTKVEIKNLNSFRAMERAVEYEIKRQTALLLRGEKVVQQTLGWDENKQATFPQRVKEGSADYRYFPDPDLPSLKLSELPEYSPAVLSKTMPELPSERRGRYVALGLKSEDADSFVRDQSLGGFFEEVIMGHESDVPWVALAGNYISNDLVSMIRDYDKRDTESNADIPISARNFRTIVDMLSDRKISSRAAKDLLIECIKSEKDPEKIAEEGGLFEVRSSLDIETLVTDIVSKNPSVVSDFKAGKAAALEYLVGQSMKVLRGAGDPKALRELFRKSINS